MTGFKVARLEQSLVIRRKLKLALVPLACIVSFLCLLLVVPFTSIFVYHYFVISNVFLAVFTVLLFLPLLFGYGRYLSKKVIVLDKLHNQVLVDSHHVCTLSDVRKVRLGKYIIPNAKNQPFGVHGLYLETLKGEAVELERLTLAGPSRSDLKEVGLAIANFAQIDNDLS